MSKSKKDKAHKPLVEGLTEILEKTVSIIEAEIKDDFCNFHYKLLHGVGEGRTIKVLDKSGLVKESMKLAFSKFNAHLAVIDQVFEHKGIDVKNVDKLHNHALTASYEVTKFKIKGSADNESVILIGSKSIGMLGHMDLDTPEVGIDHSGGYDWYNELKTAVEDARAEVELYMNGNYDPVHGEEEHNPNQVTLDDEIRNKEGEDKEF